MKTVLSIILAFIFMFATTVQTVASNSKEKAKTELSVDSVHTECIRGIEVQIVYLKSGEKLLFSGDALSVKDAESQISYLGYLSLPKYKNTKQTLKDQIPGMDEDMLNFICYNKFVTDMGLQIVPAKDLTLLKEKNVDMTKINFAIGVITLLAFISILNAIFSMWTTAKLYKAIEKGDKLIIDSR